VSRCSKTASYSITSSARPSINDGTVISSAKGLGVKLVPASAPDFFLEDTPTAVLVRQVLGAIAQFDKTSLVAKLKAARDRKIEATGKCGGRKSYAERDKELVCRAKELRGERPDYRSARSPHGLPAREKQLRKGCLTRRRRSLQCWPSVITG
jgi:hypothetical protein